MTKFKIPGIDQDALDLISWSMSKDTTRPNLMGIFVDTDCLVATNGHTLAIVDYDPPAEMVGKIIGGSTQTLIFPKYKEVLPKGSNFEFDMSADQLLTVIKEVHAAEKGVDEDRRARLKTALGSARVHVKPLRVTRAAARKSHVEAKRELRQLKGLLRKKQTDQVSVDQAQVACTNALHTLNTAQGRYDVAERHRSGLASSYKTCRDVIYKAVMRWDETEFAVWPAEIGSISSSTIEVVTLGQEKMPTIGFDTKYLLEITKRLQGKVQVNFLDDRSPAVFTDDSGRGLLFAVMPIRL